MEVQQPQEAALQQVFLLLLRGRVRRLGPRNAGGAPEHRALARLPLLVRPLGSVQHPLSHLNLNFTRFSVAICRTF